MKHTIRLSKCCRANIILTIPTGFEKCGTCGKLCQIENIPVTTNEDIAEVFNEAILKYGGGVANVLYGLANKLNVKL